MELKSSAEWPPEKRSRSRSNSHHVKSRTAQDKSCDCKSLKARHRISKPTLESVNPKTTQAVHHHRKKTRTAEEEREIKSLTKKMAKLDIMISDAKKAGKGTTKLLKKKDEYLSALRSLGCRTEEDVDDESIPKPLKKEEVDYHDSHSTAFSLGSLTELGREVTSLKKKISERAGKNTRKLLKKKEEYLSALRDMGVSDETDDDMIMPAKQAEHKHLSPKRELTNYHDSNSTAFSLGSLTEPGGSREANSIKKKLAKLEVMISDAERAGKNTRKLLKKKEEYLTNLRALGEQPPTDAQHPTHFLKPRPKQDEIDYHDSHSTAFSLGSMTAEPGNNKAKSLKKKLAKLEVMISDAERAGKNTRKLHKQLSPKREPANCHDSHSTAFSLGGITEPPESPRFNQKVVGNR